VTALPTDTSSVTTERYPLALFFDGECVFCSRWVRRLMAADTAHRTRFGAKQGAAFKRVVTKHPEAANVASVVLIRRDATGHEQVLVRSAAVLAVINGLPGYHAAALILRVTPRPLADLGYAIFSKFRKRIFGTQNVCDVVRPAEKELFLE
jgi:predicted DCC family thiol-disulfide oxidoreductase YuxK